MDFEIASADESRDVDMAETDDLLCSSVTFT